MTGSTDAGWKTIMVQATFFFNYLGILGTFRISVMNNK